MMNKVAVMFNKELIDAVRDKRSMMAALYYCVGAPIGLCVFFLFIIKMMSSPDELKITIENAQQAPGVVEFLSDKKIFHGEKGVEGEKVSPITVRISENYQTDMTAGTPATITLVYDGSDQNLNSSVRRVETAIREYSSETVFLRLIARGIDPTVVQVINIQKEDTAKNEARGGMIISFACLTVIMAAFVIGMSQSMDTSAGERERNSIALLLSHPVNTLQIVLSKVGAVVAVAMVGVLLVAILTVLANNFAPWESVGVSINISPTYVLYALILCLPIAAFASSVMIFSAFLAKTFKEAQSYVSMALFIPGFAAYGASFDFGVEYLQWVPIASQNLALIEVIKGGDIAMLPLMVSSLATLALSALFIALTAKMLKSEKVVFGL